MPVKVRNGYMNMMLINKLPFDYPLDALLQSYIISDLIRYLEIKSSKECYKEIAL